MKKRMDWALRMYQAEKREDNKANRALLEAAKNKGLDIEERYWVDDDGQYLFFDLSFIYDGVRFLVDIRREYHHSGSFARQKPYEEAKVAWAEANDCVYATFSKWTEGASVVDYGVMLKQILMQYRVGHGLAKVYSPKIISNLDRNGGEDKE